MARFENDKDDTIITGTRGNDSIDNEGSNVTINVGDGNDTVWNYGSGVTINSGEGNDDIWNYEDDSVTIYGNAGNDYIDNYHGYNVTIYGGAGNDTIYNGWSDSVSIEGGAGNDSIRNYGSSVTIKAGKGNDTIYNNWDFERNRSYANSYGYGKNVLFKYNSGDGDDIIYGFRADSTLSISGGSYSTTKSGKNIIVTVGKGKISLMGAASLSAVNITGDKNSTEKNSWKLNGSTATYGTASKTLATITGAKSTNGLTLSGNKITLKNSALKNKVTVSGDYEFNFASDYKKATITGSAKADTITANGNNLSINGGVGNDTIKFFGTATTVNGGAGKDLFVYKSGNNVIADYAEEDKISIAGTAQVTTNGSDVIFTVGKGKITVTGGKGKNITYVDAGGEHVYSDQNSDVIINGKVITLTEDYLEDSFNVADYGKTLQTIDASAVQLDLSITGNKLMNSIVGGNGNDTLNGGGSNDTLKGGAGSDVFVYSNGDGNDLITDYTEEDIIRIAKGTAKIEKKGKDVIFKVGTGKITVKGAADKIVTYMDAKGTVNYYPKPTSDSIIINGTAVTVLEEYKSDTFDVGNVKNGNRVKKIDASPVSRDLKIIGNSLTNVILGGAGDDSIWGGKGNDTLQGGDGSDVFVYANGDGKDVIVDYEEEDTIKITKGAVKVTKNGDNVIFTVGSGKMTLNGAADKIVSYIDANGNKKTYSSAPSFIEDDNNYELTPNLSSLVQNKSVDYSFMNTSTKLSKENNLIAYAKK